MTGSPAFAELPGVALPIVQAFMSGVETPRLAAAVFEGGDLNSTALGAFGAEAANPSRGVAVSPIDG